MAQSSVKEMPSSRTKNTDKAAGPATKVNTTMYPTRIALSDEQKQQTVEVMQEKLASALDMYSQAKFGEWNRAAIRYEFTRS